MSTCTYIYIYINTYMSVRGTLSQSSDSAIGPEGHRGLSRKLWGIRRRCDRKEKITINKQTNK